MLKHKMFTLNRYSYDNQVIEHSNTWWEYMHRFAIGLHFIIDDSNEVYTHTYGYGDSCISNRSIQNDDDLIISVGWNDGFGIRKLNDDGTLTDIYSDNKPSNNYISYQSLAVDTTRHHAYVANHTYNNIVKYDYSDIVNGGSTVTKTILTKANGDVPADEVGYDYTNGLQIVGDYLYTFPEDFETGQVLRMKLSDGSFDPINVINLRYNGRNGGSSWYDSVNNRLYIWWKYNGEYWVVVNPDKSTTDATSPAKAYTIRVKEFISTDDMYSGGVVIDPNNPNHVWLHCYYGRFIKVDITDVLNETSTNPTLLQYHTYSKYATGYRGVQANGRNRLEHHPVYGNELPLITPDRGWWVSFGWFDGENGLPVGPATTGWSHFDGEGKHRYTMYSNSPLTYDYGGAPIVVSSASGNQYLVYSGYGRDGYRFRTWTTDKLQLYTSGYIIWGDFKFADNSNINSVYLDNFNQSTIYIPTDTTFSVEVSNDGGNTWETYDWKNEELHEFDSVGNTVRVKVTMTGNGKKHSYMTTVDFPSVHIYGGKFYNHYMPNSTQHSKIKGI